MGEDFRKVDQKLREMERDRNIAAVRAQLEERGLIRRTAGTKRVLKRSKLNEYREKFGQDYRVPDGYAIEEDVV